MGSGYISYIINVHPKNTEDSKKAIKHCLETGEKFFSLEGALLWHVQARPEPNDGSFVIYQVYKDQEAVENWRKSESYDEYRTNVLPLLASPPDVQNFTIVSSFLPEK